MTQEQQINMAAAYKGISQSAVARELGTTPQNFNQKMKRGTFTPEEMQRIAEVLGAVFVPAVFEFPDGTRI